MLTTTISKGVFHSKQLISRAEQELLPLGNVPTSKCMQSFGMPVFTAI